MKWKKYILEKINTITGNCKNYCTINEENEYNS